MIGLGKAAKTLAAWLILSVCCAAQAQAADLSLRCTLSGVRDGAGLSTEYVIKYRDGAANVSVIDGWIQKYIGEPLLARVTRNDANSLIFKWELHGVSGIEGQGVTHLRYRGSYLRQTGQLDVRAQPGGRDPLPGARGRCRAVK